MASRLKKKRRTTSKSPRKVAVEKDPFGGGYKPRERLIYRYFNGSEVVAADPFPLQMGLLEKEGLDQDLKIMSSQSIPLTGENGTLGTVVEIVNHVRKVFQVEPYKNANGKESGLTDKECLELLGHFFGWLMTQKKSMPDSPTSWPTMASAPSVDAASATPNTSASSATVPEPSAAAEPPSPSVSALPSEEVSPTPTGNP